jgi:hypothetical protein
VGSRRGAQLVGRRGLTHYFRNARLDLNWNYLSSRGITSYVYAGTGAMTFAYTAAEAGNQFPAMTYDRELPDGMSFTVPLNDRASLRLYDYYERGQIYDWHYAGFNNTLVYGNRVYTDAGSAGLQHQRDWLVRQRQAMRLAMLENLAAFLGCRCSQSGLWGLRQPCCGLPAAWLTSHATLIFAVSSPSMAM